MHEPADSNQATDHTWPTCVTCHRNLWDIEYGRLACRPCEDRAQQRLTAIGAAYARLNTTTALIPATRRSHSTPNPRTGTTSGPIHSPLPLSLNVLNLAAAGGIATRLQAIEDSWRATLRWTIAPQRPPAAAVAQHLAFLGNNLLWACSSYPEVAHDLEEIRRLAAETTAALSTDPRPGRISIGTCPTTVPTPDGPAPCGAPLTATTNNHRIRCTQCGTTWDDMTAWRQLRHAQAALQAEPAPRAASIAGPREPTATPHPAAAPEPVGAAA